MIELPLLSACGNFIGSALNPKVKNTIGERCTPTANFASASTGDLNVRRFGHVMSLLPNNKVWVTGKGRACTNNELKSTEIFDPDALTWSYGPNLNYERAFHTVTQLSNGKFLLAGGEDTSAGNSGDGVAELYDATANTIEKVGAMKNPRSYHSAILLNTGKVLMVGGVDLSKPYQDAAEITTAELYDPATKTFSLTGSQPATSRYFHTATLLNDGRVLITGGTGNEAAVPGDNSPLFQPSIKRVEIFDPTTEKFKDVSAMGHARSHHAAFKLTSGKVMIVGGFIDTSMFLDNIATLGMSQMTSETEIFDPTTETFSKGPNLNIPRGNFTSLALGSGKFLVMGGSTTNCFADTSIEEFSESTNSFSSLGNQRVNRRNSVAVKLSSGKALLSGGEPPSGDALKSSEIVTP